MSFCYMPSLLNKSTAHEVTIARDAAEFQYLLPQNIVSSQEKKSFRYSIHIHTTAFTHIHSCTTFLYAKSK